MIGNTKEYNIVHWIHAYNDSSNRNAHEKKTHGKLFITAAEERERNKESLRAQAEKLLLNLKN